jgi:hypothetical protein
MDASARATLLAALDQAVLRVARSNVYVAAQEKRIAGAKRRGQNTAGSENTLETLQTCLRLSQKHYEMLLLDLEQ